MPQLGDATADLSVVSSSSSTSPASPVTPLSAAGGLLALCIGVAVASSGDRAAVAAAVAAVAVAWWTTARAERGRPGDIAVSLVACAVGTVAVVLGTDGAPERWAVVPFVVSLLAASVPRAAVRRVAPAVMAATFTVASAATGRADPAATVAAAAVVLGGGWFAAHQGRLLVAAGTDAERVREDLAATSALLASQSELMSLDAERTIEAVTEAVVDLGFEVANVGEVRDGMLHDLATRGIGGRQMPPMPTTEGVGGQAVTENRVIAVEDYWASPYARPEAPTDVRSVIAAPLVVDDTVVGCLIAATKHQMVITGVEIRAIEALAAQASRALDNARRYRGQRALVSRLVELDELKSGFLLSVSTDLRAPLTNVRGLAHTLATFIDRLEAPARDHLLERLLSNVDRLHDLIVGLLDFSRLRVDEGRTAVDGADLAAVVSAVVEDLPTPADRAAISLTVAGRAVVAGDEELLGRVVGELVANALTHAPSTGTVAVAVVAVGGDVVVEVRDDGPGPSAAVVEALRGDDDRRDLGAGLTMVVQTLAAHGTRLRATVDDDGCRIGFVLPQLVLTDGPARVLS